ncbi:unnamed protein product, partial [Ectocarpus sp. 8 AP-2014]
RVAWPGIAYSFFFFFTRLIACSLYAGYPTDEVRAVAAWTVRMQGLRLHETLKKRPCLALSLARPNSDSSSRLVQIHSSIFKPLLHCDMHERRKHAPKRWHRNALAQQQ